MNQEDFKPYIGKHIQVGVPRYQDKNSLFFHSGILTRVDNDGIIIQKDSREVFLRYGIIQFYCPSGIGHGRN